MYDGGHDARARWGCTWTGWVGDEAGVLDIRNEAPVAMVRSAEGSKGASESEEDGRGAPFCVRRRETT